MKKSNAKLKRKPKAAIDFGKELNPEQLRVVCEADGPCLVLAGAGSGKTRTIVYRVAYLLERGIDPKNILLLTFTNKAAHEMLSRVEYLVGGRPAGLFGGTFHSVANRILRKYAEHAGYKNNFTIMDEEDAKDIIKLCIKDLKIDTKARRFPSAAVLKSIISLSVNSRKSIEKIIEAKHPNFLEICDKVIEIERAYQRKKKQANAMDFDDLLLNLLKLLTNNPQIRDHLSAEFRYVLVDEYQDTNIIQAQIIDQLSFCHRNILVVGDDAQSIYSFRAANLKNILDFPNVYPKTKIFRLETNYRSTPEILGLANEVIEKNIDQFPKVLRSVKRNFTKPTLVPAASADQEARFIAETILEQRDQGVELDNMAVLFRATHHSQVLEFELLKRDIPYEYRGGLKFFERAHIKDALAYLRVLNNPQDEPAWLRVLNMQIGIGPAQAGTLYQRLKNCGPQEIAELEAEKILERRAFRGWQDFLNIWRALTESDNLPGSLIRAVADSEYKNYLEAEYPNWQDRLEDLEQLATFAEQYKDAAAFLSEASLYDDFGVGRAGRPSRDDERIILSTIHQAKGLEWPLVFLMHLTDTGLPNRRALAEQGGLEEERRLFYVGVTRAADQLYLTYPLTSGYDNLVLNQASMFINEIPDDYFEKVELGGLGREYKTDEDSVIVWDDEGEVKERQRPKNYLREVGDL